MADGNMKKLKELVWRANMSLREHGLVYGTQGNVSGIDREENTVYIKPSGVAYEELTAGMIVATDLAGRPLKGKLKPSVDTVHHLFLYREFPEVGGVCHTHSRFATVFAALGIDVPVLTTGHADVFGRAIPTAPYADNVGDAIGKAFAAAHRKTGCAAVILGGHGLFTVGRTPAKAAFHALMAEFCAETSYHALTAGRTLGVEVAPLPEAEIAKWFGRYHSERYGQKA